MAELTKLFVSIGAKIDGFKKGIAEVEKSSQGLVRTLQQHSRAIGASMTAVGAAGLGIVDKTRQMNAQLGVTALNLGVTTGEMRKLALATSNVTFPLDEVTKTFDLLARAGVQNKEQLKASAAAFDTLGDAIGLSASQVTEILVPALKAFGQEMPTKVGDMDAFAWLVRNTTVDLQDFGSALTYLAPDMDKLGVSIEDTVAILAALEAKGISGSAATRELRRAVTEAVSEGKNLADVLGITSEEMDRYKSQVAAAAGITQEYADAASKEYGIFDEIKHQISELMLQFGSFLEPFEPVFAGLSALGPVILFLSTSVGANTIKWVAHTAAMVASRVALIASTVATTAATAAHWLFNAALSANPIGIVILAIGGLIAAGVALWQNWERVAEFAREVWGAIVNFFKGVWETLTSVFKEHWDEILLILFPPAGIIAFFVQHWDQIKDFFSGLWDRVKDITSSAFETVKEAMVSPIKGAVNMIIDMINFVIRALNKIQVEIPSWVPGLGGKKFGIDIPEIEHWAQGGIITEPTLLYSLKSGRPYALAGEEGPETVSPAGREPGLVVNVSQLVVREEADIHRIARQLLNLQERKARQMGI